MSVTAWAGPENTNQSVSALSEWLSGDGKTGTWGGLRAKLTDRGVEFIGSYDAEVWGNTKGGLEVGTVYTGLLDFGLKIDLEKAVDWRGASLSTTWLLLSGKDAAEDLVGKEDRGNGASWSIQSGRDLTHLLLILRSAEGGRWQASAMSTF